MQGEDVRRRVVCVFSLSSMCTVLQTSSKIMTRENPPVYLELSCGQRFLGRVVIEVGRYCLVACYPGASTYAAGLVYRIFFVNATFWFVLQLFDDVCPKTCENFRTLCEGTAGLSTAGTPLHYKGTKLFRIIPNFIIQGGDILNNDGTGGECIWAKKQGGPHNRYFCDENFKLSHSSCGMVSMANEGPDTNQSQFFITCAPCPWLDGRSVVFGKVLLLSSPIYESRLFWLSYYVFNVGKERVRSFEHCRTPRFNNWACSS